LVRQIGCIVAEHDTNAALDANLIKQAWFDFFRRHAPGQEHHGQRPGQQYGKSFQINGRRSVKIHGHSTVPPR
jgi:hypothetical protein